ncbi:transcriptional regulator [Natrialba asiatica DSM 12278]|uniref:Transcriptional regulator n=2 Tax=Natrialba asiatica TaxID=64602 RepID=M0B3Y6_NATA1|nr:transcriptional regulator [Natrialba asiatica DSM 12278]
MDLPSDLTLIHQPTRLRIMGFLYRHRDVSYTRIRDLLELTDGNLASHAENLEDAGYIETRRAWTQSGFETRYRITQSGVSSFQTYLQELRRFLDEVEPE